MKEYSSNGKLLLTGEYLVLQGAEAIALPLQMGQKLKVSQSGENAITWQTIYQDKTIIQAAFSSNNLKTIFTNNEKKSAYLQQLLKKAFDIADMDKLSGWSIKTNLDFPFEWGLGSSSTLINNVAKWLNINPFKLNREITGGSGYDIACAESSNPIIYKNSLDNPEYKEIYWDPTFKDNIYFIYTGKKQDSREEVKKFNNTNINTKNYFNDISRINQKILNSLNLTEFEEAINEHEDLMSEILKRTKAKSLFGGNYPGAIKSLGAWGGDFILATWKLSRNELNRYLKRHNLNVVFKWDEIIKSELT